VHSTTVQPEFVQPRLSKTHIHDNVEVEDCGCESGVDDEGEMSPMEDVDCLLKCEDTCVEQTCCPPPAPVPPVSPVTSPTGTTASKSGVAFRFPSLKGKRSSSGIADGESGVGRSRGEDEEMGRR
jgi:hypothetical protein